MERKIEGLEASVNPFVFVRRGKDILLADDELTKHSNFVRELTNNYGEDWNDIRDIPEERINWDMGFYARGKGGEIIVGGYSLSYDMPNSSEMPIVRPETLQLLAKKFNNEKFIEAMEEEVEKWIEYRQSLPQS
jgi:hypothetical protein